MNTNITEKIKDDCDSIYLGNLNTVDTDLNLPLKSKNGSSILWESKEILFLSHEGKITRPTYGVGDRTVILTATLTLGCETIQKDFEITILQEKDECEIIGIHPINIEVVKGQKPSLPSVVIVDNNNGIQSVKTVKWEEDTSRHYMKVGSYTVIGTVDDTQEKAIAVIKVLEKLSETICNEKVLQVFSASEVSLVIDSEFGQAMGLTLEYLLSVDDDQVLYNFRKAACLDTKGAKEMTGWDAPECNLRGHTTGHYLSALALAWHALADRKIKTKLEYMVEELGKCQASMPNCHFGFLSAYSEEQFDLLEKYTTYPTIWAPYYTLHKIMAGLLDCYELANSEAAFQICIKLGDWIYERLSKLSDKQRHKMWSLYIAGEFGGMNEVLAKLYILTRNSEYLTTAKYFDNEKLFFPMKENVDTLGGMHANQHIPQVIGALKLFEAEGKKEYHDIAVNFWNMVTRSHIYPIGGVGENEMFHGKGKIAAYITDKTAETCASYNMLKLTKELYQYHPTKRYMDYYEITLYNHILAIQNKSKTDGGSTYFMPLAPGSTKKYDTIENTCCHGTGLEIHFKYHESIYFHKGNKLYINLYIPSHLEWKEKGINLTQKRKKDDITTIEFTIEGKENIELLFRIPSWTNNLVDIAIDHNKVEYPVIRNGYLVIEATGQQQLIELHLRHLLNIECALDNENMITLSYGPYVLAAIDDCREFITWNCSKEELLSSIKQTNFMEFQLNGIKLVPLFKIQDQKYHTFFKLK